jgi:hypothetical protein
LSGIALCQVTGGTALKLSVLSQLIASCIAALLKLDCHGFNTLYQGAAQQQFRQHAAHLPQQHQYHAAALASNRPAAAAAQPDLQQLLHQHDQQHSSHWQQQQLDQQAVGAQQQAGLLDAATPSSSSSSSSSSSASSAGGSISSLPAVSPISSTDGSSLAGLAGEDDPFDDVLGLSSFQQQYQATLQHLHVGHTRNLSQLAQLFDPAAVLAGENGKAATGWQVTGSFGPTSNQACV